MTKVQSTIDFREKQLQAAIESNSDKVEMFRRTIKSLEDSIGGYLQEAQNIEASGVAIAISGIIVFVLVRLLQGCTSKLYFRKKVF